MVLTPLQNTDRQFGRVNLDQTEKTILDDICSENGHRGKAVKSQIIFQVENSEDKKLGTPG